MSEYFNFRIIKSADGTEIIDRNRITPIAALTPIALIEYKRTENDLYFMDRQKRKQQREAEQQRKITYKLLHKVACAVFLPVYLENISIRKAFPLSPASEVYAVFCGYSRSVPSASASTYRANVPLLACFLEVTLAIV